MERKKENRDKRKLKKNCLFYYLNEEKIEKKKIKKKSFSYLGREKNKRKENVIIINELFILNLI